MNKFASTTLHVICVGVAILSAIPASTQNVSTELPKDAAFLLNGKADYRMIEGEVVEVIDADSLKVSLHLLPGLEYSVNVRSRGIDAPEMMRHECEAEADAAPEAAASIERKFPVGSWVFVSNIEQDKFGSRIVADIDRWISDRFQSVTEELLDYEGRWGVPYNGTGPRQEWCADGSGD